MAASLSRMAAGPANVRVWIDVDNPPQVQYLYPFVEAFRNRGAEVILTARDYGNALELLRLRGASFYPVGAEFGVSKRAKIRGVFGRARALRRLFRQVPEPDVLLSASRSSALVSRWMGIPSFVIDDYEYANSSFYRLTRSTILHPDVIDPKAFFASGIDPGRLIPFSGLKEDISVGSVDLEDVVPHRFSELENDALVRVLFRPPAETSHYYNPESRDLALHTLGHLAAASEAVVIFSPRYKWQLADLERFSWRNEPLVLDKPVPFVSLLKGVDLVVCSGGTMLREAAYIGVPAYSILKSRIGAVDQHLASIGRVDLIGAPDELKRIKLRKAPPLVPLRTNPRLLEELAVLVLGHVSGAALIVRGGSPAAST
jgi:predicted glycosyltransferase